MNGDGGPEATRQIDAFSAHVVPVSGQRRDLLHELTVSVFWPHRPGDLDLLIAHGRGCIALDEIGRPLGSAMHFPMGEDFATLGMMVTPPRLQALGGGRWLLRRIMADCAGRDLRLNATRAGYRLYESAGFVPVGTVHQHQGTVLTVPPVDTPPGIDLTPVAASDRAAIAALDARAFGADRGAVLAALLDASTGFVASRNGQPCGFSLIRAFGKGRVIGPVVAETEAMAIALIAPLLRAAQGSFVRLDAPMPDAAFTGYLAAAGLAPVDTVTEMRIGPHRRSAQGAVIFALAAHSLG